MESGGHKRRRCVTDTDAKSYCTRSPDQVLAQAESDKKKSISCHARKEELSLHYYVCPLMVCLGKRLNTS